MADDNDKTVEDMKDDLAFESLSKLLWIIIPIAVGGLISMFSNFEQDIQVLIWGVMIIIAGFGVWTTNAKKIRKARDKKEAEREKKHDEIESERWGKLDKQFEKIDEHFDDIDQKIEDQQSRQSEVNKALLRNELVSMHREWVEEKGYITLEALEYAQKTYDAYAAIPANGSGKKLWEEINELPVEEHR